jgi:hypothetical protein
MKTVDYLNMLKKKTGKTSYYAIAKYIKEKYGFCTANTIAGYDKGNHSLSDEMVIVFSKELDTAQEIIATDIQAERTNNPEMKKMWGQIARQLQQGVAASFILALVAIPTDEAQAGAINQAQNKVDSLYIMRTNKGDQRSVPVVRILNKTTLSTV